MTSEQIKISLQNGRLELSFWEKITHYGIVIYLSIFSIVLIFLHVKDSINGEFYAIQAIEWLFMFIPMLLAILYYKVQRHKLNFAKVETRLTRKEVRELLIHLSLENEWEVKNNNSQFMLFCTHPSFLSGSWGEQVAILFDKNKVLINSICDPKKRSSVVSMGRNKQNVNMVIDEIVNAGSKPSVIPDNAVTTLK